MLPLSELDILEYEVQNTLLQTKLLEVMNRFKGLDLVDRVLEGLTVDGSL